MTSAISNTSDMLNTVTCWTQVACWTQVTCWTQWRVKHKWHDEHSGVLNKIDVLNTVMYWTQVTCWTQWRVEQKWHVEHKWHVETWYHYCSLNATPWTSGTIPCCQYAIHWTGIAYYNLSNVWNDNDVIMTVDPPRLKGTSIGDTSLVRTLSAVRNTSIQDTQLGPRGVLYREVTLYTGHPVGSQRCPL